MTALAPRVGEGITNRVHPCPHGARGNAAIVRTFLFLALLAPFVAAQPNEPKRVLILMQEDLNWPIFRAIDENLRATLRNGAPEGILIFGEHLDRIQFPDPQIQARVTGIRRKYANTKLDLVVGVGDVPTDLFPGVSLVYVSTSPQRQVPNSPGSFKRSAGLWIDSNARKTLEAARRFQPNARQVVVIGGSSPSERDLFDRVRSEIENDPNPLGATYLTNLAFPEISDKVASLGPETIVLFVTLGRDGVGHPYVSAEAVSKIAAVSGAPVYVLLDTHTGSGAVGGYVTRFGEVGKQAGEMALQFLAGQYPKDQIGRSDYVFDWRELHRWKIPETVLPVGSLVMNRRPNVWNTYKWYILGAILVFLVETLLIGFALVQNSRRKRAEEAAHNSEQRFRLFMDHSPAIASIKDEQGHYVYMSESYQKQLGVRPEDCHGKTDFEIYPRAIAEEFRKNDQAALAAGHSIEAIEDSIVADGKLCTWLAYKIPFQDASGQRFVGGIGIDITERKKAREALQTLAGRLIDAQEQERARISRELHDDFSQRLALLGIGLGQLWKKLSAERVAERQSVLEMLQGTKELSFDLHTLSHELHSSRLEHVGLVSALAGLCREVSAKHKIEVDFIGPESPTNLPKDVALCLFRVAQEALGNVVKHSRAQSAQVELGGNGSAVTLHVSDSGKGFDPSTQNQDAGIGMIGMSERLRLVGGQLLVKSRPNCGTDIVAEVPLATVEDEAQVKTQAVGR